MKYKSKNQEQEKSGTGAGRARRGLTQKRGGGLLPAAGSWTQDTAFPFLKKTTRRGISK